MAVTEHIENDPGIPVTIFNLVKLIKVIRSKNYGKISYVNSELII